MQRAPHLRNITESSKLNCKKSLHGLQIIFWEILIDMDIVMVNSRSYVIAVRVAGETAQEMREENVIIAMKKALSRLKTKAGAFFDTVGFSIAWFKRSIMKKE